MNVLFLRMSSTALTTARPCSSPTWWRASTLSACELLMVRGPQTRTPPQWKCGQVRVGLLGLRLWGWPVSRGQGRGVCLWGSLQVALEPSVGGQARLWFSLHVVIYPPTDPASKLLGRTGPDSKTPWSLWFSYQKTKRSFKDKRPREVDMRASLLGAPEGQLQ